MDPQTGRRAPAADASSGGAVNGPVRYPARSALRITTGDVGTF